MAKGNRKRREALPAPVEEHALYSPSAAHRWMNCAAAVQREQYFPDTSSDAAEEGTAAHELAADVLINGGECADRLGQVYNKRFTVDDDMAADVQRYVNYVRGIHALACDRVGEENVSIMIEARVQVGELLPESGGTADCIIYNRAEGALCVIDFKFGRGTRVDAVDNEQLMLYAVGAYMLYAMVGPIKTISMAIHQPRKNHIDMHTIETPALQSFLARARAAYEAAIAPSPNAIPGAKQCRWCRAKAVCPEAAGTSLQVVTGSADAFPDLSQPLAPRDISTLDNKQIGQILPYVDMIVNWCEELVSAAHARANKGEQIPGFKLVEGRKGNKAWIDKKQAEATLKRMRVRRDDMYSQTLITPTQAEKLKSLGPDQREKLQTLFTQADGKPKLVPESDKRPALEIALAENFENLDAPAPQETVKPKRKRGTKK
jgi:hypothetical protein